MKAGSKVEFKDVVEGMRLRRDATGQRDLAVEGVAHGDLDFTGNVITMNRYVIGRPGDTFTLLRDFNEPKLPEREGLVVASYRASKTGVQATRSAGENVLGHWRDRTYGWVFLPAQNVMFGISSDRITAMAEVSPIPDDALELLARLQREGDCSGEVLDVLNTFFRRVNEVSS